MCSVAQSVKRYGRFADAARESLEYFVTHLVRAESRPSTKELGSIAFTIPCTLKHLIGDSITYVKSRDDLTPLSRLTLTCFRLKEICDSLHYDLESVYQIDTKFFQALSSSSGITSPPSFRRGEKRPMQERQSIRKRLRLGQSLSAEIAPSTDVVSSAEEERPSPGRYPILVANTGFGATCKGVTVDHEVSTSRSFSARQRMNLDGSSYVVRDGSQLTCMDSKSQPETESPASDVAKDVNSWLAASNPTSTWTRISTLGLLPGI